MITTEKAISALHTPSHIRSIPMGWRWERLDAVTEGVFDCPHSTPVITESGPLVARSQDIRSGVLRVAQAAHVSLDTYLERIARAEPRYGDLLFSREGTYFGSAADVPSSVKVCLGQRMVLIRPHRELIDFRFLRFWLNSPVLALYVSGFRDGSVAERLNMPTIRALPVLVPPLPEQLRVSEILGLLDDKIDMNQRTSETLEAMARTLFKSWFVDFDPVYAKSEGRKPAGMDAETARLFPDVFDESEFGDIPSGWKLRSLPDVIEVNPFRPLPKGVPAPYVEMQSIPTQGPRPSSWPLREYGSGMRFMNGDTLMARITPCLENGKTAYVDFLKDEEIAWGSTEYIVLRPRAPLPYYFGYLLARDQKFREFAIQNMTGTTGRQRVPAECFQAYRLAVPPPAIAIAFGKKIAPLMDAIGPMHEESRTLAELRDTLLPKLMSGELRIKDAEKLASAAL